MSDIEAVNSISPDGVRPASRRRIAEGKQEKILGLVPVFASPFPLSSNCSFFMFAASRLYIIPEPGCPTTFPFVFASLFKYTSVKMERLARKGVGERRACW